MSQAILKQEIDVIEPLVVPTVHADGIAAVVLSKGRVYLVLYEDHLSVNGSIEHHVVQRLVMDADVLQHNNFLIGQAVLAAKRNAMEAEEEEVTGTVM